MRVIRILLANWCLFGMVSGLGLVASGCGGGSKEGEVVVPKVAPAEAGKDSMDFYKSQMKGGAPKK